MTRRKRNHPLLVNVPIFGIAEKGLSVGRTAEGQVVFVKGAVPGDVVDVQVLNKKKGYMEGTATRFLGLSSGRATPFCQHFEECGGCKWQNLQYAEQLKHKEQVVHDALIRIGKIDVGTWYPILGATELTHFRNKLEFGFSPRRWHPKSELATGVVNKEPALGFHPAGAFDKIIDITECHLQPEPSNALRNAIREIGMEQNLEFYDPRLDKGYLRQIMFRITSTGEVMLLVAFGESRPEAQETFLQAVAKRFEGQIDTIVYCINQKVNDFMYDLPMHTWSGKGFVVEKLGDLSFKIGPKSFFQTNTNQAHRLYDIVLEFAQLTGNEVVYDLYTGTGSIALYAARHCKHVVGIEEIADAITDAEENMQRNGITNAQFYAGDVKEVLSPEFAQKHGKPDVIITDPPRAGMHPRAVQWILDLAAPCVVYVSCNPATQARDLAQMAEKYSVEKVRAVDMFPHTSHVESVALLRLKV